MGLRSIWNPVRLTLSEYRKDRVATLGAALAFYTVFSLAPTLVIVIALAGRILGEEAVRGEIVAHFGELIGEGPASQIETLVRNASSPRSNLLAAVIGTGALILGATGVFTQLKQSLNTIWDVVPKKRSGVWSWLRDRLFSLVVILGITLLLLVSLVVTAAVSAVGKWAGDLYPGSVLLLLEGANFLLSFAVITLLFAMIFKVLPDARIAWRDVWVGAAVTAFLFTIGKSLIGIYLGRSTVGSVFGAAGSLAVLLVWIYYSAVIFLVGAEFTQVFATRRAEAGDSSARAAGDAAERMAAEAESAPDAEPQKTSEAAGR